VLTYPLVGNYGVPERHLVYGLDVTLESAEILVAGLAMANVSAN
jgi:carbamoylphosphate synthase small subunit